MNIYIIMFFYSVYYNYVEIIKSFRSHKLETHHLYHKDGLLYNHIDVFMIKAQQNLTTVIFTLNFILSKSWQGFGVLKRKRTTKWY